MSCNEFTLLLSCFIDRVVALMITSRSETFLYRFSLETLYCFSRTTSSPLSTMSPRIVSVASSMLGCDRLSTYSSSNFVENLSYSVLCIPTEATGSCDSSKKLFLPDGLDVDSCVLSTTSCPFSICTTVPLSCIRGRLPF